jgi:uncharacterized membrane protein
MSESPPVGPAAPDWEYLIAHHLPDRYCRTLGLRVRTRTYHVCARCTGELAGFTTLLVAFLLSPEFAHALSTPLGGVVLAFVPSVAWIDWLGQSVGPRESTNSVRLGSGALVGAALGGLVAFGLARQWLLFGSGLAVVGLYLAAAAVTLQRAGVLERVVAEHFP